ncbi:MAG: hypothetical protein ACLRXC_11125 [[Clostridium] leptum]
MLRPWVEAGDEVLISLYQGTQRHLSIRAAGREAFRMRPFVAVDTLAVTFGQALLVRAALEMRDRGCAPGASSRL